MKATSTAQALDNLFADALANGTTPPTPREVRAVAALRAYLDRQEDHGETSVSIVAVRMILGRV